MKYYLMDLERTIGLGRAFYWKPGSMGYTTIVLEAGLYSEEDANRIVRDDFNNRTVKIAKKIVDDLYKNNGIG